jgi:hypothetical protein
VSGDILKEQAAEIFIQLPKYNSFSMPLWSNGWLQGFQRRFGIKEYVQHGEAGSVPEEAADEMVDLRQLTNTYQPRNVFNMDQTGLFWRRRLSRGLATEATHRRKKDKTRITALLYCNTDGTEKLPLSLISTAKSPRALKGINVLALSII